MKIFCICVPGSVFLTSFHSPPTNNDRPQVRIHRSEVRDRRHAVLDHYHGVRVRPSVDGRCYAAELVGAHPSI